MNLHFAPTLDLYLLWGIALCGLVLLALSIAIYKRGALIRCAVFCILMLPLLNPSIIKETRGYVKDVVAIIIDQSMSQDFGERQQRSEAALSYLKEQINGMDAFDLRIVNTLQNGAITSRTDLFNVLDQSIADVPTKRRGGAIFLSDGQVHDVPQNEEQFNNYGPVHLLLSGEKSEKDRRIIITKAPAYGLVGKNVEIKYRIEDSRNINQEAANVVLTMSSGAQLNFHSPINEEQSITVALENPSQNIFSIEVDSVEGEITQANNKAAIIVNGVRDRLKVLLVSGSPNVGERTWRNLLTSDAGVDLVHFTILRDPSKMDAIPKNELSLIAFPFRELFEIKLYDFDLIVFDRYRVNNLLPSYYFGNIARYVKEGGAFLEASGSEFADKRSIYNTAIGDILPGKPTGNISNLRFKPKITELGHSHPVTKSMIWNNRFITKDAPASWGSWMRYIDIQALRGDTLMSANDNNPLLLLDRVGKGRVAQISSDHIWLWSRGYDGGGPHTELLRRVVHWLMKEPELDERALDVSVNKNNITIRKQNNANLIEEDISLTKPDGEQEVIKLKANESGLLEYKLDAEQLGIYAFADVNGSRKFAIIGDINPLELGGVITITDKFKELISASNGTAIWLDKTPKPRISAVNNAKKFGGSDWLALKRNNDYNVTGIENIAILPEWAILLMIFSALILLWLREGQSD